MRTTYLRHLCFLSLVVIVALLTSCKQPKRTLLLDGYFVEGDISKDTVFNGLIRFYRKKFHILETEAYYVNGKLHGKCVDFYDNGKPQMISNYENGKSHGFGYYFQEDGTLEQKSNYYHGLYFGPQITFRNGKPYYYEFISLEGQRIFEFEYDQLNKVVKKHSGNSFFFYYPQKLEVYGNQRNILKYLIYLPNPPYFRLKYDFVITDSAYNIYYEKPLIDSSGFTHVVLDPPLDSSKTKYYALRLNLYDSTDHSETLMFKKMPSSR